jgi:predicted Zn-dependent protease
VTVTRRQFGCALCGLASLVLVGRTNAQDETHGNFLAPGYRPPAESDEKGLWSMIDRAERRFKDSRFVVRDPTLNAYVRDVVCRLGKDYCHDLRIYIVRTPRFNASMAPNGMMQIWTGLLLRCNDEAQLAAILGHEMGHYLKRHTVERWRDARDKAALGAVLGLGLTVAGAGNVSALSDLAVRASIFAFSRDQEREADDIGLELMVKAGYTPLGAPEVWEQLIAEAKAGTAERASNILFATHPEPEERLAILREKTKGDDAKSGERGRDRYQAGLAGVRKQLIHDELALRQYGRSEVVFERLLAQTPDDGLLWFAKGEVYRLRGGDGDRERALDAYETAIGTTGAPPETYRSIVIVELKRGERERAEKAFERYLELRPNASDAEGLRMILKQ